MESGQVRIGVEAEGNILRDALSRLSPCEIAAIGEYHRPFRYRIPADGEGPSVEFGAERDGSLTGPLPRGRIWAEITSPPIRVADAATWVHRVFSTLGIQSARCAGHHVHISADDIYRYGMGLDLSTDPADEALAFFSRWWKAMAFNELALVAVASPSRLSNSYCQTSKILAWKSPREERDRYQTVNILPLFRSPDRRTVEIRIFPGSGDADKVTARTVYATAVALYCAEIAGRRKVLNPRATPEYLPRNRANRGQPFSAALERMFYLLGWIKGVRREAPISCGYSKQEIREFVKTLRAIARRMDKECWVEADLDTRQNVIYRVFPEARSYPASDTSELDNIEVAFTNESVFIYRNVVRPGRPSARNLAEYVAKCLGGMPVGEALCQEVANV